jgi:serine/threonine-protein kinase
VLLERVGRGMSGEVYRSRDPGTGRDVVVKCLVEVAPGDNALARFAREVALLARLPHPGLLPLLDADLGASPPYLVAPWMAGGDLRGRLAEGTRASSREVAQVGARLAGALAHLHEHGVVHRDLKPANVLLDAEGTAYLADLGLGAHGGRTGLTRTGYVVGTPMYFAPEVREGKDHSEASDQYSLARVLLDLGLGRTLEADELDNPGLLAGELDDLGLRKALRRALRTEADQRFASVHDLADELTLVLVALQSTDGDGERPEVAETVTETEVETEDAAEAPEPGKGAIGLPEELRARYRALRCLGSGGMGAVFLCRDEELGRSVAVKLIQGAAQARALERFENEARVLSQVRSPHVLEVYDFGVTGGTPYLVSEALEGTDLATLPEEADPLEVMLQAAEGLQAAHEAGLVHRDVKPANLFRTRDGRVVVLDFGLALGGGSRRLTRTGAVLGTPRYMAPECFQGGGSTPAADWYAWGATLFGLLEGRPAVPNEDLGPLARGTLPLPPTMRRTAPESPAGRVLRACLQGQPEARPRDLAEIRRLLDGEEVGPSPELPAPISAMPARRSSSAMGPPLRKEGPGRRGLVAGAFVVACLGLGWFLTSSATPPREVPPPSSAPSPVSSGLPGDLQQALAAEARAVADDLAAGLGLSRGPAHDRFLAWLRDGGRPEDLPEVDRAVLAHYGEAPRRAEYPDPFGPFLEDLGPRHMADFPPIFALVPETHPWVVPGMGEPLEGWHARALAALGEVYREDRRLTELAEQDRIDVPTGGTFMNKLLKRRSSFASAADFAMVRPGGHEAMRAWIGPGRRAYRRFLYCAGRALAEGDPRGLEGLYLRAAERRPHFLLPDALTVTVPDLMGRRLEQGLGAGMQAVLTSRLQELRVRFDTAPEREAAAEIGRWRRVLGDGLRPRLAPLLGYGLGRLLDSHRRSADREAAAADLARFAPEDETSLDEASRRVLRDVRAWLADPDSRRPGALSVPDLPDLLPPPPPPPRPYLPGGRPPPGAPGPPLPPRLGHRLSAELQAALDQDLDAENRLVPAGQGTPFRDAFHERGWPALGALPVLREALEWIHAGGEVGHLPRDQQELLRRYDGEAEALGLVRPLGPALEPEEHGLLDRRPAGFGFGRLWQEVEFLGVRFRPPMEGWDAAAVRRLGRARLAIEEAVDEVLRREWALDYRQFDPNFLVQGAGRRQGLMSLVEVSVDAGLGEEIRAQLARARREFRGALYALGRAGQQPGGSHLSHVVLNDFEDLAFVLLPDLASAPPEVLFAGPVHDGRVAVVAVMVDKDVGGRAERLGRPRGLDLEGRERLWRTALAYAFEHLAPPHRGMVVQRLIEAAHRAGRTTLVEEIRAERAARKKGN